MTDFFKLFELDAKFDLDPDELESKYLALQSKYHPDKARTEDDKIRNIKLSADINEGYKTLDSDILRAEYLMGLKNIRVNKEEDNTYPVPQHLLMEQLSLREKVFDSEAEEISAISSELKNKLNSVKEEFAGAYEKDALEFASEKTVEMRYIVKLLEEIKKLKRAA